MREFSSRPDTEPEPAAEVADHPHEPTAPAEPAPVGVLSALLDFVLPHPAQVHGASMGGRNPRQDLIQAAGHIGSAVQQLKSVAADAMAAQEFAAADSLNSLIERLQ
jgi:hypothetical protein